jgi:hypothetical protein
MKATSILLMILSLCSTALAQSGEQPEMQPAPSAVSVQPETENGVTHMCGGVGLDESTYMKRAAKDYDLMSTFAAQDGSYLADVNVDISDRAGKSILQTTCSGPILLVKFPRAGTYRIRAEMDGHAQTKTTQVQAKRSTRTVVFVWPASQTGVEVPRPRK